MEAEALKHKESAQQRQKKQREQRLQELRAHTDEEHGGQETQAQEELAHQAEEGDEIQQPDWMELMYGGDETAEQPDQEDSKEETEAAKEAEATATTPKGNGTAPTKSSPMRILLDGITRVQDNVRDRLRAAKSPGKAGKDHNATKEPNNLSITQPPREDVVPRGLRDAAAAWLRLPGPSLPLHIQGRGHAQGHQG